MPVQYKIDILAALREAGYSSTRIRNEKIMGQATLTQLRHGELVSWKNIGAICRLLNCQPGDILKYGEDGFIQDADGNMRGRDGFIHLKRTE